MTGTPGILVVTSCTSLKTPIARIRPVAAEDLYTGQQHIRLMRGVQAYRQAGSPWGLLDLRIVSACHGLVDARTELTAYDESFTGLSPNEIKLRADTLGIPGAIADLLSRPRRLTLLLLGDNYLQAAQIVDRQLLPGPVVALTSPRAGARLPSLPSLTVIPLYNPEARRYSCGLTALKGELGARVLKRLAMTPDCRLPEGSRRWSEWLDGAKRPPAQHADQMELVA